MIGDNRIRKKTSKNVYRINVLRQFQDNKKRRKFEKTEEREKRIKQYIEIKEKNLELFAID